MLSYTDLTTTVVRSMQLRTVYIIKRKKAAIKNTHFWIFTRCFYLKYKTA